jgi:uncharacterized protein (TIGR02444 family)
MIEESSDNQRNALWRFSLNYYSKPGVADACLFLQDHYKVDVNVLLLLLWLAAAGKALSVDEVAEVDGQVKQWRDSVVAPLRTVRRSIQKSAAQSARMEFRASLKMLELHSERIEQDDLFALFKTYRAAEPDPEIARSSLESYALYLNCSFQDDVITSLLATYGALHTV